MSVRVSRVARDLPPALAGVAAGMFLSGYLEKLGTDLSVLETLAMVVIGTIAMTAISRLDEKVGFDRPGDRASYYTLLLLGAMAFHERFGLPRMGMAMAVIALAGMVSVRIEIRREEDDWAGFLVVLPVAASVAFSWELASGSWNGWRFAVIIQIAALALFVVARGSRKLNAHALALAGALLTVAVGLSSWKYYGPHCDRQWGAEAFQCYLRHESEPVDAIDRTLEVRNVSIGGTSHPAVAAPAPSTIILRRDSGYLDTTYYVGMIEPAWEMPGDGVQFTFYYTLDGGATWTEAGKIYIDPKNDLRDRQWVAFDMDDGAGVDAVRIEVTSGPEITQPFTRAPDNRFDWAVIGFDEARAGN